MVYTRSWGLRRIASRSSSLRVWRLMRGTSGGAGIRATSIVGIERCTSGLLDVPGSTFGTTPTSLKCLPLCGKELVWACVGENFVGDDRRGDFRPGRGSGTAISSRGRFGVDPRDCGAEGHPRALSEVGVHVRVCLGAFEDDDEGEGVGSVMRGSWVTAGACCGRPLQSSSPALRFLWLSGKRSSIGGFGKRLG